VNRSPIGGVLSRVRYQKGQYLNAMNPASADRNEQNAVTVKGEGFEVTFKQIAGLLARRIVFNLARGRHGGARAARGADQVRLAGGCGFAGRGALRVKVGAKGEGRIERAGGHAGGGEAVNGRDPAAGQSQGSGAAAARHVPAAFAVYRGQHRAGFFSITETIKAISGDAHTHLDWAAIAIIFAIPFDTLDGRIARMTNTTSEFGKELDSLADAITFGVAPSLLALIWGFHFLPDSINPQLLAHLHQAGAFICFLFLIGGVSRLARFNISHDAQPRNPGRPGRKYFVGMPIPAAAGFLASTVHLCYGYPILAWWVAIPWLVLVGLSGFLMVSTWRFWSGKEINFSRSHPIPTAFCAGDRVLRHAPVLECVFFAIGADLHVLGDLGAGGVRLVARRRRRRPDGPVIPDADAEPDSLRPL
jgi:CDP-diacylglycerol---serine O-phosphatidyltransferase